MPLYPATEGISAAALRKLAWEAFGRIRHVTEPLPAEIRAGERLADRPAAVAGIHFPDDEDEQRGARERLAFEALPPPARGLGAPPGPARSAAAAPLEPTGELVEPWLRSLPFELTNDQRSGLAEIDADLEGERPMQRLLMGEVGSGKTVLALAAMLRAAENDRQAALMAPTETLAEQRLATLDGLLGGLVPIELLTGIHARRAAARTAGAARRRRAVAGGGHARADRGAGGVPRPGRGGCRRAAPLRRSPAGALDAKARPGLAPHALHMTATPIPRTLALTAYGDLDATILRELPAGRHPVETHVVDGARARSRAYQRFQEIASGRQCFVVCPLVEESEALQAAAAEFERLRETEFGASAWPDPRPATTHAEKQRAMESFAAGDADVLVATSVIEVGIDVPNASVMLIEGSGALRPLAAPPAARRGRTRGTQVALHPLRRPQLPRLTAIAGERDGFRLAEIDLELRGAGDPRHAPARAAGVPRGAAAGRRPPAGARPRPGGRPGGLDDPLLREAVDARFGSELEPIRA